MGVLVRHDSAQEVGRDVSTFFKAFRGLDEGNVLRSDQRFELAKEFLQGIFLLLVFLLARQFLHQPCDVLDVGFGVLVVAVELVGALVAFERFF